MPHTPWPGLPDATVPEPGISLGAVRSRFLPSWIRTKEAGRTADLRIRAV